ncbi:aldehyde ferredoxin oxidoreductase N-terminal domain-containing protein [Alkaliphilus peptidifermentans]|uniref:Aldehyde ferredoxin oxidoreductase n=1 Tax=Alkaliphilus peptidifermentans DSM 18978 TaxID=1120976 RepID=A0A1G5JM84_9FIRM|nr:aldehyde ferredoxin oxidoreductase N-terminal domain-containing protein [Alkaliphilus peptidifermentans]SCY89031.1 Aldehyde ferredoxin oxidoreductase [Alkaliphilus peptidifermentans DSM 18978]
MKIVHVDLNTNEIITNNYNIEDISKTGRGLATSVIMEIIKPDTKYLSKENCIVLTPGLLTGTQAPCTGRLTIAAKGEDNVGIKSINVAGPISQKLASLHISAIVIHGKRKNEDSCVLHISEDEIKVHSVSNLRHKSVDDTIDHLQGMWGEDTSIIGIGPAGEHVLPIASVFSTYSKGYPKYYCSRGKMGDIFGYKGIKAIAVTTRSHFNSPIEDEAEFRKMSKKLGKMIIQHPVCGGALPAYGSITLIHMMKDKTNFLEKLKLQSKRKNIAGRKSTESTIKINKNCAPNCVIGCLNRHSGDTGEDAYSSPAESEAVAACKELFNITDDKFVKEVNKKCFEMGVDTIEFLFSCNMLLKAMKNEATKEKIHELIKEVELVTPLGRIVTSTTKGIHPLFAEVPEIEKMITLPAIQEEKNFIIKLQNRVKGCEKINDMEMLYGFMTLLGNLGICLFTSFAILDMEEGLENLAQLIKAKTGMSVTSEELIKTALNSLQKERAYKKMIISADLSNSIPEFVKVLYRYYSVDSEVI